jgi:hypothetical protein
MLKFQNAGREAERGNVLFLILIAVALFAALSYAVTQSSRSGGGDANSETNLVNSATITQYPASVRTAIIRQIVSKNVAVNLLRFNTPSTFGTGCTGGNTQTCVFHPDGGGATYVLGSADVMSGGGPAPWVFNGENEINLVGTSDGGDAPSSSEADIIAFLPGIKQAICEKINEELGIISNGDPIPTDSGIDVTTQKVDAVGLVSGGTTGTIGGAGSTELDGQGFGCFDDGGTYIYYHVLIEQ